MLQDNSQVDMHIHTTDSDGTWTIEELLELIIENNIKVFFITDHDTVENGIKMINRVPSNIQYVIGVEVSCTYNNQEYHVTAYDFDYKNTRLNELLRFNRMQRGEFNARVIQYVKKINKIRDVKDYFSYQYDRKRGRWASLNYLLDKGLIKDIGEYFEIVKSSNENLRFKSPEEIIEIIKCAGGYPFLAHPSAYEKGEKLPLGILEEWKNCGISGIECFSPYLKSIEDANYYIGFCKENDLMISAGSDCHGRFNNRVLGIPRVNIDKIKLDFIKSHI